MGHFPWNVLLQMPVLWNLGRWEYSDLVSTIWCEPSSKRVERLYVAMECQKNHLMWQRLVDDKHYTARSSLDVMVTVLCLP